ncbi:hypothetical protein [Pseudomonas aeruginosa]|nr:hypothetical protein [Pseudomonas aeruginosa]MCV3816230.1 hypothetical protein [Pseudomonas aeruginosa]HBO4634464.1 hypothetical protein [Pseudomonas aeruginosa]HBO5169891.1 hypothetical protein [Pseudomonas aeruginosa]
MTESKGRALRGDFLIATSSLPGSKRCRWLHYAIMPFLCQALKGREDYNEEHPLRKRTELPLAALRLLDHLIAFDWTKHLHRI